MARDAEIQRRAVAIAAALAAGGEAREAAMELGEEDELPPEVLAVAALEKAFHESEVPTTGKRGRPSKGGKARKSRVRRVRAAPHEQEGAVGGGEEHARAPHSGGGVCSPRDQAVAVSCAVIKSSTFINSAQKKFHF